MYMYWRVNVSSRVSLMRGIKYHCSDGPELSRGSVASIHAKWRSDKRDIAVNERCLESLFDLYVS